MKKMIKKGNVQHIVNSARGYNMPGLCEESVEFTLNCLKRKNRLVLHFDVNETIMIGDEAGGDTYTDSLNKIVAKCALVQKKPIFQSDSFSWDHWRWYDGTKIDVNAKVAPQLSFDWDRKADVENFHAMVYETNCKEFNSKVFTCDGQPGRVYRDELKKLNDKMKLPPRDVDERLTLNGKNYFVLPTFFHTLAQLEKQKRDFIVVVRTFGRDGSRVAKAINAWAEGRHPLFENKTFPSFHVDLENDLYVGRYDREDKSFKVRSIIIKTRTSILEQKKHSSAGTTSR